MSISNYNILMSLPNEAAEPCTFHPEYIMSGKVNGNL